MHTNTYYISQHMLLNFICRKKQHVFILLFTGFVIENDWLIDEWQIEWIWNDPIEKAV